MSSNQKNALQRMATEGRRALSAARNWVGQLNPYLPAPVPYPPHDQPRVLVVGIYLASKANLISHLVSAYGSATHCQVQQLWVGLGGAEAHAAVRNVTARVIERATPKFVILNELLAETNLDAFDYLLVSDDDIRVRPHFVDSFIGCQQHFDFAVAQPARTLNSFNDHDVVRRRLGSRARQTWFVEIGPVFSIRRDASDLLLPFEEASPMGYGYDFMWPKLIQRAHKRMGIVDCCPVDHSFRRRSVTYGFDANIQEMQRFLATHEHESYGEAMRTVKWLR